MASEWARFWSKVERSSPDGCWLWGGRVNAGGYGEAVVNRKSYRAHRLSFELFIGPVPEGHIVRHTCDVRACVNPSHLLTGTHKDNSDDCGRRGRRAFGSKNGAARLVPRAVLGIRADYAARRYGRGQRWIAAKYGVSQSTVRDVVSGKLWGWVQ